MNKKLLLILAATFTIILIAFSFYNFHKPIPIKIFKDSPFSILLENATDTYAQSTEWYEVNIDYPKNSKLIRDEIFGQWDEFNKEYKLDTYKSLQEAKEPLGLFAEGAKYTFYADFNLASSTDTISYIYEIYTFTGGAHGSTMIYPITLDKNLQVIPVEKILPDEKLEKVSKLALTDLIMQRKERMKSFEMTDKEIDEALKDDTWMAEGTKPTRENYSSVWIDGDNLVISFGQYQVAAYAEGTFEVRIPLSQINN